MADIIIRKRVALDFLGEDYKDAYLVFRSIPVDDYDELLKKTEEANDSISNMSVTINTLKDYFLSGSFPDAEGKPQELSRDDLGKFDKDVLLHAFGTLTGQNLDPKDVNNSTTPSTTEPEPPSNS